MFVIRKPLNGAFSFLRFVVKWYIRLYCYGIKCNAVVNLWQQRIKIYRRCKPRYWWLIKNCKSTLFWIYWIAIGIASRADSSPTWLRLKSCYNYVINSYTLVIVLIKNYKWNGKKMWIILQIKTKTFTHWTRRHFPRFYVTPSQLALRHWTRICFCITI